ncbi:MAG: glyoxylate/hydroxypyruvate reductase A [Aliishimia sp.]
MTLNILFAANAQRWADYETHLHAALSDLGMIDYQLAEQIDPKDVDYIIYAPDSALQDFTPYVKSKAVLNLWAGVEAIVGNPTLHLPLARMVDPSMTQGMMEWVTGHCLRHHLGMDTHITATPGTWEPSAPPVTWDRKIAVLGMGALGAACARSLAALGFEVHGWSRSLKQIEGLITHHGPDGLRNALNGADGVVLLLPKTPETENTLNGDTLPFLAQGAFVLNPGRGPLIDDAALIEALNSGQIGHATLDVFRIEPLPQDDPYWRHPNVTVTPHIASETRPAYAAKIIAENIRRGEAGEPFLHLVDRNRGY